MNMNITPLTLIIEFIGGFITFEEIEKRLNLNPSFKVHTL